jgi:hypothetical protein
MCGVPLTYGLRFCWPCFHSRKSEAECRAAEKARECGKCGPYIDKAENVPAVPKEEGRKLDTGKADLLAIAYHPISLSKVAAVLDFGAEKYTKKDEAGNVLWSGRENWRKVPNLVPRYLKAALRHLFARCRGEILDPDSGLPHLAHACCCLLFILELGD